MHTKMDHPLDELATATPGSGGWRNPALFSGAAVLGLVLTFIGFGVDAYNYRHGDAETPLLTFDSAGRVLAASGLVVASIAALCVYTMIQLRGVTSPRDVTKRFIPITAAWVFMAVALVGSITYGASARNGTIGSQDTSAIAATSSEGHAHATEPQASTGTSTSSGQTGASAAPHKHDQGEQPTFSQIEASGFDQLASQFPANTMTAADYPLFKQQVEEVRAFADRIKTPDDARSAGYSIKTGDIPYMGEHWISDSLVVKGTFDPSHPQGLLFAKVDDGPAKLVGVWFLLIPGLGGNTRDTQPSGFAGNLDVWHAHTGLCFTNPGAATENETKESCDAKHGLNFTPDLRWMMHVWVVDGQENPDGVFHYLNSDLYRRQLAAGNTNPPLEAEGTIAQ